MLCQNSFATNNSLLRLCHKNRNTNQHNQEKKKNWLIREYSI